MCYIAGNFEAGNSLDLALTAVVGQRRGRQRERQKETIGLESKTTTFHVHHTCLYISLPVFARKQTTTTCYFNF